MELYRLGGLLPLASGVYGIMLAQGILPRNPQDPQKAINFRRRFGTTIIMAAPMLIVFGALLLLGIL